MSLAKGTETKPCASKAPGRRNGTGTWISNREPRVLVVWGTRVTRARSVSPGGMLMTSAGLTFAARPRSTSQTSPRCGVAKLTLALVQLEEHFVRRPEQLFVGRTLVLR